VAAVNGIGEGPHAVVFRNGTSGLGTIDGGAVWFTVLFTAVGAWVLKRRALMSRGGGSL
jgi:hypothetical protein